MANYIYTLEDVLEEINNNIIELKEARAAWETVKRVCKKDGGNFARIEKNFETESKNTSVQIYDTFYDANSTLKVKIFYWGKSGHTYDTIYNTNGLTADDVAAAIEKRKSDLDNKIANAESGYKAAEKRLKKAAGYLDKVRDILKEARTDGTYYTLRDYVVNYIER